MITRVATGVLGPVRASQTRIILGWSLISSSCNGQQLHFPPARSPTTSAGESSGYALNHSKGTRHYATDASPSSDTTKSRGRPKKSASEKTTTTNSGRPRIKKKATPKKKRATKKKPAATKKKPVAKKKKPAAKKPKTVLSPLQMQKQKVAELRKKALLKVPKLLPPNGFTVFMIEGMVSNGPTLVDQIKELGIKFKSLSVSEREHYANIARANKGANAKTMQDWVERHTPDDIRIANNARRQLNKIRDAPRPEGAKHALVGTRYRIIQDARAPIKRLGSPFVAFCQDRWANGDFKGVRVADVAKQMAEEWKSIGDVQKEQYLEIYNTNKAQYDKDYNAIFTKGKKSPPTNAGT